MLDQIVRPRRVAKGDHLYHANSPFRNLFAVRYGHFKTYHTNVAGEDQITGFQMPGDLLAMDSISSGHHQCGAIALEDSQVCEIEFSALSNLFERSPTLLRHFNRIMSCEMIREQGVMLLLGSMRAEQRLAVFLTNLSARYRALGYSEFSFNLRMSREEIGNYLGLTIESISRLFTRFKNMNLVKTDKREITLIDSMTVKKMAAGLD